MPDINYIDILKRAWNITWHNRYLWWFGLLIALSSPGMNYNLSSGHTEGPASPSSILFHSYSEFINSHMQIIIISAIVLAVLIIILVILGIIARAGLIKSIDEVCKSRPASFKSGMKEGKKYFGRLFLLGIAILFIVIASIMVLSFPVIFLFVSKAYALGIFLGILAFLILIPVLVLASFFKIFGYLYIVLGELSAWNALEKAYELFQRNLLASIIMGLMFIPLGFILMMAAIAVLIPLAIIFFAIGFALYYAVGISGVIITASVGIICFLIFLFALRSVYETFAQTVWYLFFLEIARPKIEEKVEEEVLEKEEKNLPVIDPVKTAEIEK